MSSSRGSAASWPARLALVAVGLFLGVVAAEVAARFMAPDGAAELLFPSTDNTPEGLYVNSHVHVSEPQPGFVGRTGAGVPLRINAAGLRGPALSERAESSRWLVLGDSFVMSLQVPEEQTFEERLSVATGTAFLNGGVDGYATWQATSRLAELAPATGAKGVVVVFFLGNDLQDNERYRQLHREAARVPDGTPIIQPDPHPLHALLAGWSRVYGHGSVWWRRRQIAQGRDPMANLWAQELQMFHRTGAQALQRSLATTEPALRQLRDTARRLGLPLLVATAPPAFAVHTERAGPTLSLVGLDPAAADLQAPDRAVLGALKRLGIASCDLGPDLRSSAQQGVSVYLTFDGHWTSQGHAVVADTLQRCLTERGWATGG